MVDTSYELVKKVHHFRFDDLPGPVIEKAKELILDTLGTAVAGSTAAGCREVVDQIVEWGGSADSTVLIYGHKVPAFLAAFTNSVMAHGRDFDETHDKALTHAFVSVLPAALAVSEQMGNVKGTELLTAIILGAEVLVRLGLSLKPEEAKGRPFSRWHFSAISGFFGSAITAGKLLELDKEGLHNAMGIVYSQVAGSRQPRADGALTKRMQPGFAAQGGVFAAYLARKGITGAKNILDGEYGFFRLYREESMPYDETELLHEFGQRFEVLNISVKPYPCARPTHAAIRPTIDLVRSANIQAKDVDQVNVLVPYKSFEAVGKPFEIRSNPQVDAQFSIPYTVAVAITRRNVTLSDFEADAVGNPETVQLAKRVAVTPNWQSEGWTPVRIDIKMKDGRVHSAEEKALRGDPQNPMSREERLSKFKQCTHFSAKAFGEEKVDKCIEAVENLERLKNAKTLVALFV